ncbi:MAG: glycosyltransferase family 2 protein [Candidatus Melainabacteria bacterium]
MTETPDNRHGTQPEISVVIPVYGCARCLSTLHQRLVTALSAISPHYEIIYVDDASPDEAWAELSQLAAQPGTRAVQLSRNFGQQAAITAGLSLSRGRWTVVMDCDLQDPPEYIKHLYDRAREGYDLVLGKRKGKQHTLLRRLGSRAYFAVLNRLMTYPIDPEYGTFSILSRPVVDGFLRVRTHAQHYLFILNWLGYRSSTIEYAHGERADNGDSGYTLGALVKFAIEGLLLQTTRLLRGIVYGGFFVALVGFFLALYLVWRYFAVGALSGWTSLSVLILVVGGSLIFSLGIVGLYVGKIFEQVQARPQFVIAREA